MLITIVVFLIIIFAVISFRGPRPNKSSLVVNLKGLGWFEFDIVGEASYQDALLKISGGKKEQGAAHYVDAELYLEDDNPYDSKAVCVYLWKNGWVFVP